MSVALYCRLSPRPDGSYEGVDEQEQWGREYAAQHWPGMPVRVFADKGRSAFHDDLRPGYEALKVAIDAGQIRHLWTVEQSRLERREVEWFQLATILDDAGIDQLHTNRDGVVRVRDEVSSIKAVLAASEVRKLRRRVMDKQDASAAAGRPPGACVFGYSHCTDQCTHGGGKTLHVIDEQADAIRWAAERALAGWSLANLARELTDRGHLGARGGPLTATKVRKILCNPTVAGVRVHRGRQVGPGNWAPILDADTAAALRRRFERTRVVTRSDGGRHSITTAGLRSKVGRRYLLTGGLARCGECGAALVGVQKQYRSGTRPVVAPYLICSRTRGGCGRLGIKLEPVEEHVIDELLAELDSPAFRAAVAADENEAARKLATAELERCESRRGKLAALWATDELTDSEWSTARTELDERESAARAALGAIPPPLTGVDLDVVREAWPSMTLDERRELLRLFIESVVVQKARPGTRSFDTGRVEVNLSVVRTG